jgi:GNAT superfamily N-acetyltransferase
MKNLLKALARVVLGDYAPYYILECGPAQGAQPGPAGNARYRVAPIDEAAIRNCPDPLIREQANYAGADALAYACLDGDRIVGICFYWHGARYLTRNFWPLKPREAKLVQIITSPDMRGKKVAGTLIAASCTHVLAAGFERAYARVWHSNEPSLRAFYGAGWTRRALVLELNPLRRKKPMRLRLG